MNPNKRIRYETTKAPIVHQLSAAIVRHIFGFCDPFQLVACQGVCHAWQTVISSNRESLFRHMDLTAVDANKLDEILLLEHVEKWIRLRDICQQSPIKSIRMPLRVAWLFATSKCKPEMFAQLRRIDLDVCTANDEGELQTYSTNWSSSVHAWIVHLSRQAGGDKFEVNWPSRSRSSWFVFEYPRPVPGRTDQQVLGNLIFNGFRVGQCQHDWPWSYTVLFVDQSGRRETGHKTCQGCIGVCQWCWKANSSWHRMGIENGEFMHTLARWPHSKELTLAICHSCYASACASCAQSWSAFGNLDPASDYKYRMSFVTCSNPACEADGRGRFKYHVRFWDVLGSRAAQGIQ